VQEVGWTRDHSEHDSDWDVFWRRWGMVTESHHMLWEDLLRRGLDQGQVVAPLGVAVGGGGGGWPLLIRDYCI